MTDIRQLNITPEEINSGKTMALVAYIIFFIPLLIEEQRKNKFVMYHTEQSILLVILNVIICILGVFLPFIYFLLVLTFVLWIIGLINAVNGKVAELPIIGQFGKNFNLVK